MSVIICIAFALHLWRVYEDERAPDCPQIVQSKAEASEAIGAFFSKETKASQRLISALKEDGTTDETLTRLRGGCQGCYYTLGEERFFEEKNRWYLNVSIAPPSEKRSVILRIDCASDVSIQNRLFGG